MQQRYYDPQIGGFLSVDPVTAYGDPVGSFNRYKYASNNPYRFTDPDGRCDPGQACHEPVPSSFFRDTFVGRIIGETFGDPIALARSDSLNPITNEVRSPGQLQDAKVGIVLLAMPAARTESTVAKGLETAARGARDALSSALSSLTGKARPATVTGGFNVRTGEVAARACGGGKCAEDHVVQALGGNKAEVKFTEAVRPRTGAEVPVCQRCESTYGRDAFPKGTKFKSDEL